VLQDWLCRRFCKFERLISWISPTQRLSQSRALSPRESHRSGRTGRCRSDSVQARGLADEFNRSRLGDLSHSSHTIFLRRLEIGHYFGVIAPFRPTQIASTHGFPSSPAIDARHRTRKHVENRNGHFVWIPLAHCSPLGTLPLSMSILTAIRSADLR